MDIFCREVRPFAPLIMDEIRFWLRIMQEHAFLICQGLASDQTECKKEAEQFQCVFGDLERRSCQALCGEDFCCFIEESCIAVNKFFIFKRKILHCLIECKICGGCLYPLLLDHMSREALYFLKLLHKFCHSEMPCEVDAIISENIFWLRIMAEHLSFTGILLDPSERRLIDQVQLLREEFEQIGLKARDLGSMLWHYEPTEALIRFEKEVNAATVNLCEFQVAVECAVKQCTAVSSITPLIADHTRRETEHFLAVLELIRKQLANCGEPQAAGCRDYD